MKNQKSIELPLASQPTGYQQQTIDRLAGLELRMEQLIRAIEVNNELLRTMQEQQNRVCTNGSGSVIVRM